MSAYAHQMEREFSSQSLSSRGGSEIGSRYVVESGIYMTSFAATIFVGALATTGILLITLLVALTVMLQSCENRSKGVVEMSKSSDDSSYCMLFSLHAELNNLGIDEFPVICKVFAVDYIKTGQYARDLHLTMDLAQNYFDRIKPVDNRSVLIDIDAFLLSNSSYIYSLQGRFDEYGCSDCLEKVKRLNHIFILKLYKKLKADGWPLVLLTRKPEKQQNATVQHLSSAGYCGWSSLLARSDEELQMDSREYFSRRKRALLDEGFHIAAIISSQVDAFAGAYSGERIFKLPNPIFHHTTKHHMKA